MLWTFLFQSVIQRAYGVLLPQLLLLYNNDEDSKSNPSVPLKHFDLKNCLAVQTTDVFPEHFGFMLLVGLKTYLFI